MRPPPARAPLPPGPSSSDAAMRPRADSDVFGSSFRLPPLQLSPCSRGSTAQSTIDSSPEHDPFDDPSSFVAELLSRFGTAEDENGRPRDGAKSPLRPPTPSSTRSGRLVDWASVAVPPVPPTPRYRRTPPRCASASSSVFGTPQKKRGANQPKKKKKKSKVKEDEDDSWVLQIPPRPRLRDPEVLAREYIPPPEPNDDMSTNDTTE